MSRSIKTARKALYVFIVFTAAIIIGIAVYIFFLYSRINFEADERLFESSVRWNSTTFYADSEPGGEYTPVELESSGSIRKSYYMLDEISDYLKDGFIAVEDKIFYDHSGVDVKRTVMAAINLMFKGGKSFGASTITQQVVKNISGDNQPNVTRKLSEIIRALHIEANYSKDDILEVYLNVIPMSDNIYGVGAASRAYFGKEPSELTPYEAATLIGITNAPSAYNPYSNPDACLKKRNIVLSVMSSDGVISDEEYILAIEQQLQVISREDREDRFDSWFVETVIEELIADLVEKYNISTSAARMMLMGGGYKVFTTMNISVQNILERYFENEENFPSEIKNGLNYAMVVTDSKTGDLVGIIGRVGKKEGNRLLNHATVPHLPASALKPLALYAPLIEQKKANWATVFDDVPVVFYEDGEEYREYPKNSPAVYDGLLPLKDAVRLSKNTVAVKICNILGVKNVFYFLQKNFDFDTLIEKNGNISDIAIAPMALGQLGRGVSLLRLTEGYSTFVGDGIRSEARSYVALVDYNGETLLYNESNKQRVFSESTARIMNQLLMNVTGDGTAKAISIAKMIDTAGKTGTSGGNKDKIFVGYTPYFTAGIWCGYDSSDNQVVGLSKGHLEIWDNMMIKIHQDYTIEQPEKFSTEGLVYLPYCVDSGEIYSEQCRYDVRGSRIDYGYFTYDNKPETECARHIMCLYDSVSKGIATNDCPEENLVVVSLISVNDRKFPKQICVTDAEYVYRDVLGYQMRPSDPTLPYFEYAIPEGGYVGISKSKKQFNSGCNHHIK